VVHDPVGRDSLIAGYQTLPFVPELCRTTLRALADLQSDRFDDVHDAEPGKIMHELRHGELVYFGERPQTPYYGTCDATPLFLVVLDEYERWTGDTDTVGHLEPAARAALTWIERYGDLDGDGYLEYRTRNPRHGLTNQCWKDSPNSVLYPDGSPAPLPRATCELQGYAYDARIRAARLARLVWNDPSLADRLERDAAALRDAFNRDFWLAEQGAYALALDGDKRLVPTISSNMGHLLWSGIVPPERVDALTGHLLGDEMFSGWGIRTVAAGQAAYNPIGYHVGAVWPHDNAIIAAGLRRYGRRGAAGRIAGGILDAAPTFGFRLPEAFAGEHRARIGVPLPYPRANYPQAWASAAPLLFIRVLLGLDPSADGATVDPHLPPQAQRLALSGVHFRGDRVDVSS
jgi:glycogen debranching enzyme